jgi:hypothetical protein
VDLIPQIPQEAFCKIPLLVQSDKQLLHSPIKRWASLPREGLKFRGKQNGKRYFERYRDNMRVLIPPALLKNDLNHLQNGGTTLILGRCNLNRIIHTVVIEHIGIAEILVAAYSASYIAENPPKTFPRGNAGLYEQNRP